MKAIEKKIKFIEDKLFEKENKVLYLNNLKDILSYGQLVDRGEHIDYKAYIKSGIRDGIFFAFAPE